MQKHAFANGGFVIHKIRIEPFAGRFSAWFDATGALLDAEQIDALNRSRRVTSRQWSRLASVGLAWK